MSIAETLSDTAYNFNFDDLPTQLIYQSKRILVDAMGCCLGAYSADAVEILRNVVKELGGTPESTIIGSGLRTTCTYATLVNGLMVRYLDFNDLYVVPAGKWYVFAHPSDSIPAILAVGERMHSSGKDIVTAIVLSYEFSARFSQSVTDTPLSKLGWNDDTRGVYIMPLVLGKLLGLNKEQLENAVGISGCHGMILGILDTGAEEYCMSKSLRYHLTSHDGIMAAPKP
jgi:2-methylcitrate dehydratase